MADLGTNYSVDGQSFPAVVEQSSVKCKMLTRYTKQPCPNWALPGKTICRAHGGSSDGGPVDSAKYSSRMPLRLRERYEQLVAMPGYVELQWEIGLAVTRIEELIERAERNDSTSRRRFLLEGIEKCLDDWHRGLGEEMVMARLKELREEADSDRWYDDTWDQDIRGWLETLKKLKEAEIKRMVAANQVLTVTESYNLITRLASFIEDYLTDIEVRAKAVRELHGLLERKSGGAARGALTAKSS
jgi:hypothetical protein